MEKLYHETHRLIIDIQNGLSRVEQAKRENAHVVENEVLAKVEKVEGNCETLQILVNKEPPARRPNAKMKVDQLKYDCQHLNAALRNIQHRRHQREQEERDREELLARRFTANDDITSIMIDHELQHNTSLHNSHRDMDNMLSTGSATIANLRDQRSMLKGAQRKMFDVTNMLGLSNTVMRLTEKRTFQDKIILFGGMALTLVVMYFIYKYFG